MNGTTKLKSPERRATLHANRVRQILGSEDNYCEADEIGVALLSSLLVEYERLPMLAIDEVERIKLRVSLTTSINAVRRSLAMTKPEKAKIDSAKRGRGRPKNNDTWEGIDI